VKLQIIDKNTISKIIIIVRFGIKNISKNEYNISQIAEIIIELTMSLIKRFFGKSI
jgi:hypothetical protein